MLNLIFIEEQRNSGKLSHRSWQIIKLQWALIAKNPQVETRNGNYQRIIVAVIKVCKQSRSRTE